MSPGSTYYNDDQSQPCTLELHGNAVYIYLHGDKKDLHIWHLKSTGAEWTGDTLTLRKNKDPEQYLLCSGEQAKAIHQLWLHPLPEEKPKGRLSRNVLIFISCIVFVVILFFILFYLYALPWLAERSVALVPADVEIELGDNLARVYEQQSGENDSVNYFANQFVKELRVNSKYPLRIDVIPSPEINAFALPGGRIFIYSGLLEKMDSYKELAALLGHEITHVIHQHSLKSIFRGAAAGMVISSIFGNVSQVSPWIISKADAFKQLGYSRELETEADENGVRLMVQNRVDPHGMLELLHILKNESVEEPALMKYLSTHPDTDSRIAAVEANPSLNEKFPENEKLAAIFQKIKLAEREK